MDFTPFGPPLKNRTSIIAIGDYATRADGILNLAVAPCDHDMLLPKCEPRGCGEHGPAG